MGRGRRYKYLTIFISIIVILSLIGNNIVVFATMSDSSKDTEKKLPNEFSSTPEEKISGEKIDDSSNDEMESSSSTEEAASSTSTEDTSMSQTTTETTTNSNDGSTFTKETEIKKDNINQETLINSYWGTCPVTFDSSTGILEVFGGEVTNLGGESFDDDKKVPTAEVKEIVFHENVKFPIDSYALFARTSIEKISGPVDTSNVVDMSNMFDSCNNLKMLDLNSWDTSSLKEARFMFYKTSNLENISLNNWNTENLEDMKYMFAETSKLTSLSVNNWNTSNVQRMDSAFQESAIQNIDLSNWDTSKVTDMSGMFSGSNLENVDLSNWATSNLKSIHSMFSNCQNLKTANLSNWDITKLREAQLMFQNAKNLTNLNLDNWDTITMNPNLYGFFSGASKLQTWTLGPRTVFGAYTNYNQCALSAIDTSSKIYSGAWTRISPESPKSIYASSDEFINNYDGSMPGTYTWQKQISAKPKETDVLLGSSFSEVSPYELVINVQYKENNLNKEDYTVVVENTIPTDTVGKQIAQILVTYKEDPDVKLLLDVPINILWGNTIAILDQDDANTNAAVSLLENSSGNPYIIANKGNGFPVANKDTGLPTEALTVRPNYMVFRGDDSDSSTILNLAEGTIKRKPIDLMDDWNSTITSNSKELQYGDVARIHVRKWNFSSTEQSYYLGEKTNVSRNEELVKESTGYKYAYYELTKDGYRLMYLNQFKVIDGNDVLLNTSKENMNQMIDRFIELPEGVNQSDYRLEFNDVETDSVGTKSSTINVYEKLQSGGEFKTTYTVSYNVFNDEITGETVSNQSFNIGHTLTENDLYSLVQNVRIDGKEVDKSKYSIEISGIDTNYIGQQSGTIKLINTSTGRKSDALDISVEIVFADSLLFQGTSRKNIMALTLGEDSMSKKPIIYSNRVSPTSAGITQIHAATGDNTYISVGMMRVSSSITNFEQLSDTLFYTQKWKGSDSIDDAYKKFETQEYQYGDIVSIYHRQQVSYNLLKFYQDGEEEDIYSSNDNWFELTPKGYRQIYLPYVTGVNQIFKKGTSEENITKNIQDFVNKLGQGNISVIGFVDGSQVDTSNEGTQTVEVEVQETLNSGKKLTRAVPVNITINPVLSERFVTTDNVDLQDSKETEFDYGTAISPNPEQFISHSGDLYKYVGYKANDDKAINEGLPPSYKESVGLTYVYEKADNFMNITIPTELVFGTYDNNQKVTSKKYAIKNNSDEVSTNITLEKFEKIKSDVRLLEDAEPNPTSQEAAAKLNLIVDNDKKINGLTEKLTNKDIVNLAPNTSVNFSIEGQYFGDENKKELVQYSFKFKFKTVENTK